MSSTLDRNAFQGLKAVEVGCVGDQGLGTGPPSDHKDDVPAEVGGRHRPARKAPSVLSHARRLTTSGPMASAIFAASSHRAAAMTAPGPGKPIARSCRATGAQSNRSSVGSPLALIAPPEVFRARPAAREVRDFVEDWVGSWDEVGLPDTEVVVAPAAFLAINNMQMQGELRPATLRALGEAWRQQSREGHWPNWVKCNWPPFETDDHYGVTLMMVAMGMAPASYTRVEPARSGIRRLQDWLTHHPAQEVHHRAMLLWAGSLHHGLITEHERQAWIAELLTLQKRRKPQYSVRPASNWRFNQLTPHPRDSIRLQDFFSGSSSSLTPRMGRSACRLPQMRQAGPIARDQPPAVRPLAIAMVEASFGALLVPAIRRAALLTPCLVSTPLRAVALPAIAPPAHVEHRPARWARHRRWRSRTCSAPA